MNKWIEQAINNSISTINFDYFIRFVEYEEFRNLIHALKQNTSIHTLDFSGASLDHSFLLLLVELFKDNQKVLKLNLSSTNLSDHGAFLISQMLKGKNRLSSLNLSGNDFTPGENFEALNDAIKNHSTLN
jgi:hypothetical protein